MTRVDFVVGSVIDKEDILPTYLKDGKSKFVVKNVRNRLSEE